MLWSRGKRDPILEADGDKQKFCTREETQNEHIILKVSNNK